MQSVKYFGKFTNYSHKNEEQADTNDEKSENNV